MSDQAADEAIEAIRSAVRALRAAERALKLARQATPAPVATEPEGLTKDAADPAEKALYDFLFKAAQDAKEFEEQDPQAFRTHFEAKQEDLLEAILRGDMFQTGPKGSGMVSLDNTDGTQMYEVCLRAMRKNNIHQTDLIRPFVEAAEFKNWGDVDTSNDVVIMRYETPGPVEAHLDESQLASLMEAARKSPGAVDRCRSRLTEQGIHWDVSNAKHGSLDLDLKVDGVCGKWTACIPADKVMTEIVSRLGVVEVDYDATTEGWWDAARVDHNLPQKLLPIIRGKEPRIVCLREDLAPMETWAADLPGWYDGDSTPLILRDAVADDILQ